MARALTTKAVEAAKPDPAKRLEVPDPALSGLYLVVQPSGAKSWALRYRYLGKPRKLTLGRWPIMGVAAARAAASEAVEAVEHGNDPGAAKKAAKAERIDAQLSERDTVRAMFDLYTKRRLTQLKAGNTVQTVINKHVMPKWGDRRIQDIARRDVIELLRILSSPGARLLPTGPAHICQRSLRGRSSVTRSPYPLSPGRSPLPLKTRASAS